MRVGKVKSHVSYYSNEWSGNDNTKQKYTSVQCVDGFMMITQYDIPWREDLFTNWHFYDISQGFEFRRAGYKVVVPYMQNSWCFHYAEIMNLTLYEEEKEIFRKEYEVELRKNDSIVIFSAIFCFFLERTNQPGAFRHYFRFLISLFVMLWYTVFEIRGGFYRCVFRLGVHTTAPASNCCRHWKIKGDLLWWSPSGPWDCRG